MSIYINFKEVRAKLRFVDVFRHYAIEAKIKGDRATSLCPLHNHPERTDGRPRTASLSVNLSRNIFQCFGCKASGNVLDFCCRMEGFDPSDATQLRQGALKVADMFGIRTTRSRQDERVSKAPGASPLPMPTKELTASNMSMRPALKTIINAPLDFELKDLDPNHWYLSERGFTPETIERFGLGFCNRGLMKGRIAIPLHDCDGKLIGYAGRVTKDSMITSECPKYRFPGDREREGKKLEFRKSHLLYNHHRIRDTAMDVVVVEGFTGVWWLDQCKFENVVALMGSSCSNEQADLIARIAGRVWIMTDGDASGRQCAQSLWDKLGHRVHCRNVKLCDGQQPTSLSQQELESFFRPSRMS